MKRTRGFLSHVCHKGTHHYKKIRASWVVNVLMCWCIDVLMYWCVDLLMCWCVVLIMFDALMYWCVDCVDALMCVDVCWCVLMCVDMCWCVDVLMCVDMLMVDMWWVGVREICPVNLARNRSKQCVGFSVFALFWQFKLTQNVLDFTYPHMCEHKCTSFVLCCCVGGILKFWCNRTCTGHIQGVKSV